MRQRWRRATAQDVHYVVPRLRQVDVEECRAMFGIDPASLFARGWHDETYCIYNRQGTPVALGGVYPLPSSPNVGQIWMCATDELENHQIEFLKYCKKFITEVTAKYDMVYNYVDARNAVHLKWLQWCGFTFINKYERWGAEGRPFYIFTKVN